MIQSTVAHKEEEFALITYLLSSYLLLPGKSSSSASADLSSAADRNGVFPHVPAGKNSVPCRVLGTYGSVLLIPPEKLPLKGGARATD